MESSFTFRLPGLATSESALAEPARPKKSREPSENTLSDESLILQVGDGSSEALAILFRRHARTVRGIAYRVLRDVWEADDLLQDIFLLIHRKCAMFNPSRGPARFWILQMTYHRALARRRYRNSRHFYTRVDLDHVENDLMEATGSMNEHRFWVDGLLGNSTWNKVFAELSKDQSETLRLFFVEGYTLGEIAAKLNQTRSKMILRQNKLCLNKRGIQAEA